MSIHSAHPFPMPDDPVRRLRGRLGGVVSLWTSGQAGLTVSSMMVANGDPARLVALVDPLSDLYDELESNGTAVVQLLSWRHRDLAEAFAGTAPAPGGAFRLGSFERTMWGPRLIDTTAWAGVAVEDATPLGWSQLVTVEIVTVAVGEDDEPLFHRRGRYRR